MIYGTFIEALGEFSRELTFLARAAHRKDKWRDFFLDRIKIEPSDVEAGKFKGVATDVSRLHIVDPLSAPGEVGLEAGFWRPLKQGGKTSWIALIKETPDNYPPYRNVIPAEETAVFTFELGALPRGESSGDSQSMVKLARFFREFPEPVAINWNHLNALDACRVWTVYWYGGMKALLFRSGTYTAAIMPLRMESAGERG